MLTLCDTCRRGGAKPRIAMLNQGNTRKWIENINPYFYRHKIHFVYVSVDHFVDKATKICPPSVFFLVYCAVRNGLFIANVWAFFGLLDAYISHMVLFVGAITFPPYSCLLPKIICSVPDTGIEFSYSVVNLHIFWNSA